MFFSRLLWKSQKDEIKFMKPVELARIGISQEDRRNPLKHCHKLKLQDNRSRPDLTQAAKKLLENSVRRLCN